MRLSLHVVAVIVLSNLKESTPFCKIIIPRAAWREKSKISKCRLDRLELYSTIDKSAGTTGIGSYFDQMGGAKPPQPSKPSTEVKKDASAQAPGMGSYFDQMGGAKPPQPSKPSTEVKKDASAQAPGMGSYFDQMGGAKTPQPSKPSTEVKKDASAQAPGMGSYFDQMGGAKPPQPFKPSTEVKKDASAQAPGMGSYFDQMGGAKPPQPSKPSTEVKKDASAQAPGMGSYFDQMGGAKPPQPSKPSTEVKKDASAQAPGMGSYFDQMGGAKTSQPSKPSTEVKKDASAQAPGMGSYFDQMGGAKPPQPDKPSTEVKKDASTQTAPKQTSAPQNMLGNQNPLQTPVSPKQTPAPQNMLGNQNPLQTPVAPKQTSVPQNMLGNQNPLQTPVAPKKTPVPQNMFGNQNPLQTPVAPKQTSAPQNMLGNQNPLQTPVAPKQTPAPQNMLGTKNPLQTPVSPKQTPAPQNMLGNQNQPPGASRAETERKAAEKSKLDRLNSLNTSPQKTPVAPKQTPALQNMAGNQNQPPGDSRAETERKAAEKTRLDRPIRLENSPNAGDSTDWLRASQNMAGNQNQFNANRKTDVKQKATEKTRPDRRLNTNNEVRSTGRLETDRITVEKTKLQTRNSSGNRPRGEDSRALRNSVESDALNTRSNEQPRVDRPKSNRIAAEKGRNQASYNNGNNLHETQDAVDRTASQKAGRDPRNIDQTREAVERTRLERVSVDRGASNDTFEDERTEIDRDVLDALLEARQRAGDIENKRLAAERSTYTERAGFEERAAYQARITEDIRVAIDIYEKIIADEEAKIAELRLSALPKNYPSLASSNFEPQEISSIYSSSIEATLNVDPQQLWAKKHADEARFNEEERQLALEIFERRKKAYDGSDTSSEHQQLWAKKQAEARINEEERRLASEIVERRKEAYERSDTSTDHQQLWARRHADEARFNKEERLFASEIDERRKKAYERSDFSTDHQQLWARKHADEARFDEEERRLASEINERRKKAYEGSDASKLLHRGASSNNYSLAAPLKNYSRQTRNNPPASSKNFFQKIFEKNDRPSSSFNIDRRQNSRRNSGREARMPLSVNDSFLAPLKIDPQQILAKKDAEETRVNQEKLVAAQIVEDVMIAWNKAHEIGDSTELVRLAAIQATAEKIVRERNQELSIIAEQKRLVEEMAAIMRRRKY